MSDSRIDRNDSASLDRDGAHARADEELEFMRFTVERAAAAMMWILPSGRFRYANEAACRMYGGTMDELLAADVSAIDIQYMPDRWEALWKGLRAEGLLSYETSIRCRDGSLKQVQAYASFLSYRGEELTFVTLQDITERKRNELDMIAAKEHAEKSERLKDAFIANISHEIRTPLNAINGYAQMIQEVFEDRIRPGEKRFFDSMQRGSERLIRTVDEILNFSRVQAGDIRPVLRPVDLAALTHKLVTDVRVIAQQRFLSVTYINEIGDVEVMADEYYLGQTLRNVVDNALKYTLQGSITVRLHYDAADHVAVEVRDTGVGISAEYLPSLFEPYSQEHHGHSRDFDGIGLGLALVQRYLKFHDATITVGSEKGAGSSFVIHLAERRPAIKVEDMGVVSEGSQRKRPTGGKPSVLVVEDDALMLEYLELILKALYEVRTASSASEAMRLLKRKPADIILMDISLKGRKNGLELTKDLRKSEDYQHIPIIALTAHAFPSDREACMKAGCSDFIAKPMSKNQLYDVMNSLLRETLDTIPQ